MKKWIARPQFHFQSILDVNCNGFKCSVFQFWSAVKPMKRLQDFSEKKKFVEDLSDQDFIHNGTKLVNHLMHPSRVLSFGGNLCHIYHNQLLLDNMSLSSLDNGLQQSDVDRPHRMNWESA